MRKRISRRMLGLVFCICFLSGCGEEASAQKENFSVVSNMRAQVKNEGIFYIDGYTEMMKFYDFHLAQSLPICDRPNCEHNSSECNAYFSQGYMSGMGCYRDKLYYYDNMSPGLPFYQCDKNGSNRKVLAELNGEGSYNNLTVNLPMFFIEDEAVFGMEYFRFLTEPVTREDGTVIDSETFWMFGKINLTSGKFEIMKEPEKLGDSEWIVIGDYMGGNIFYTKAGGNDVREMYRYDLTNGRDMLLFGPDDGQIRYLGTVHEMQKAIYMEQKGNLYDVFALDVQTGKTESVFQIEKEAGKEINLDMVGSKVRYCVREEGAGEIAGEEFGLYDFVSGEEKEITKDEYWYAPLTAETEDWYVGVTEDGTVCIPKKAYEKKDWSKAQIIGSF